MAGPSHVAGNRNPDRGGRSDEGCTEFTAERLEPVLREACASAAFDPHGAVLLRLGSNAVYRLTSSPVIVRIARDPSVLAEMDRAVKVARWLEAEGFPATRVPKRLTQPCVVGGLVVTFWESVQETEEYASTGELAGLLRGLHRLRPPESLALPGFVPSVKLATSLQHLSGITVKDREFLKERADEIVAEYDRLEFELPFGVIHGDANVGNVLRHRNGHAVLIDLDGFACAPREWDLVLTAAYHDRYGWHTQQEYREFVRCYGFDVTGWPGYDTLADLRELMMVAWLGRQVGSSGHAGREFARRMRSLRTGAGRKNWHPL